MIRAVLFDLDGTLLDIDLESFLSSYFGLLGPVLAGLVDGGDARGALGAVLAGTRAMSEPHPGQTNEQVFRGRFKALTGVDIAAAEARDVIQRFYEQSFPQLQGDHGPRAGADRVVEAARELGMVTVLATNPIFPRSAVIERLRWAGLTPQQFDLVTSYENASACKPALAYFLEIADTIAVNPRECLMVGDDARLDLAAASVGMKTFFVGSKDGVRADMEGGLEDLADLLPRLATRPS